MATPAFNLLVCFCRRGRLCVAPVAVPPAAGFVPKAG